MFGKKQENNGIPKATINLSLRNNKIEGFVQGMYIYMYKRNCIANC